MSSENRKFMRILVFFDLPVTSKTKRKQYQQFRKFLLRDGYFMIQYSVYSRICNGSDAVEKHLSRLEKNIPEEGSVRYLQITDKQYASMKLLVGAPVPNEKKINKKQMTLF